MDIQHIEIIRNLANTRPIVWQTEINGKKVIIKDFRKNRFFFRNTVGRFLVWREERTYRKLAGIKGIPKLYGTIDGLALVIEFIAGKNLGKIKKSDKLPSSFFDFLDNTVRTIHDLGIVHCDLKKASNIILGEDGFPYIIDWAASIHKDEFDIPILKLIYERFRIDDELAIIKHKLKYAPYLVTKRERIRYNYHSPFERFVRKMRDTILPVFQKLM